MTALKLVQPAHRELSGGDLLAQCLGALGVDVAFGIHGGHLDAFLMGCDHSGIRLVDTRHETAAVNAAESFSKVSGKVGVAFVTANSGFSNGLPGLATAMADRSKIFVITSSPPLRDAETNCLQGFLDQVVIAKTMTKFAHRVMEAEEIPRLVAHAYRVAISGAPGPVLIDFPIDILFRPVLQNRISWGSISMPLPFPPGPNPEAIIQTIALWRSAKRPAIVLGSGSRAPKTAKELLQLIQTTQTPIFQSGKGVGTILHDHPLSGGSVANLAKLAASGESPPDLIILLGVRTGMFMGGRSGAILPNSGCKFVQVDIDGAEIGRSLPVDIGIVSGVTLALAALNEGLKKDPFRSPETWPVVATGVNKKPNPHENDERVMPDGRMNPYFAIKELFSSLEPGAIISIDGGESGSWSMDLVEFARPFSSFFSAGYLGMLSSGYGYSLGAAIADPSRQIINIQGDGSSGFHIQELDTFARWKLNILTVVVNNDVWGMSIHGQEMVYKDHTPARPVSRLSPHTEYHTVAEGFQNASARVDNLEDIKKTVKRLSTIEGPGFINLIVSDKPTHEGTVAMVSPTDDPNWIVVPYYDNVPRPFYKPSSTQKVNGVLTNGDSNF